MTIRQFFFTFLCGLWLVACGSEREVVLPSPSPTSAIIIATNTPSPATAVPQPTDEPTATATTAATPTSHPTPQVDPFTLARQLIEGATLAAPDGWQVQPCKGEAPTFCISDGLENVGYAELLLFPLSSYDADHPINTTASQLPDDIAAYTDDDILTARQALLNLAEEHLAIIANDRAITTPDDTFRPLPMDPVQMGLLPGLAFGFVRTDEAGQVQERYLNVAAFDQQLIYWFSINYDPGNISTFVSDEALSQFAPFFHQIAARLPIGNPPTANLPTLPPIVSYTDSSGDFPPNITWTLATELTQSVTAVAVLSQPAQVAPLTAEQAAALAQSYGFTNALYVESRSGLSIEESARLGMYVAFDGSRTLSFGGLPYSYSDLSNRHQGPDLPFEQAAPIVEQFLQESGWLTFPYTLAESDQGEGVLFLPVIDGVELLSPAYSVRVAGNGRVSDMSIFPLDTLTSIGSYPILTAEIAWQQLQTAPNQPGTFYRIVLPALEPATSSFDHAQDGLVQAGTLTFPTSYTNMPAPGGQGDFYTNIWAYRPLDGEGAVIIQSSDFFRVTGDTATLEELAEQTDYVVHLWGTVREPSPGLMELELSRWEAVPDAGGVPMFFGTIQQDGAQTFLVDEANRTTYLLPNAPASLQANDYAAVAGLPKTVNGSSQLAWQKITVYPPPQPEGSLPLTAVPMQALTIESIKLVYKSLPASITGIPDNLFIPAWQFAGTADNGAQITLWVTAVLPEDIALP